MTEPGSTLSGGETGGRRRLVSLRRREEIISAAAVKFAEKGYHNVGMREIADAMAIRSASLYNHFGSKEEILYAICLRVTEEPVRQQLPLLDAPGTPAGRLALLVRGHLLHLAHRQVEHLVGLHEMAELTPEHRDVINATGATINVGSKMSSPPASGPASSRSRTCHSPRYSCSTPSTGSAGGSGPTARSLQQPWRTGTCTWPSTASCADSLKKPS
jgi:AcrR family transcriptional regulator